MVATLFRCWVRGWPTHKWQDHSSSWNYFFCPRLEKQWKVILELKWVCVQNALRAALRNVDLALVQGRAGLAIKARRNLREPVKAGGRVHQMQTLLGKQSAVEGARHSGNEEIGARPLQGSLVEVFSQLVVECGKRHKHGVEVVAEEVVEKHSKLHWRWRAAEFRMYDVHDLRYE